MPKVSQHHSGGSKVLFERGTTVRKAIDWLETNSLWFDVPTMNSEGILEAYFTPIFSSPMNEPESYSLGG